MRLKIMNLLLFLTIDHVWNDLVWMLELIVWFDSVLLVFEICMV